MTQVGEAPLSLVTGASGFIGTAVVQHAQGPLRLVQHRRPLTGEHALIEGDLLDASTDFGTWTKGVDRVLHLARPAAGSAWRRRRVAARTVDGAKRFVAHLLDTGLHGLAVHGSLSYGDRGEDLVGPESSIHPVGYAKAYARGEAPWRHAAEQGRLGVVRAPWVLGPGSWFDLLYTGPTVPVFDEGHAWMSIVTREGLARWLWTQHEAKGVFHPPLLARVRQRDFASLVAKARGVPTAAMPSTALAAQHGRQARAAIMASLRLDDGRGETSESEQAMAALEDALHDVVAGRS